MSPAPNSVSFFFFFLFLLPMLISGVVITNLPGFKDPLPFYLQTGYVNVDEENGAELFYYFIKSEGNNSRNDPVILWLTGGPRCSVITGLALEIGPLKFVSKEYDGSLPSLVYNPYAWTKSANIIFVDSPVGSGFSFSRNPQGYDVGDISSSKQVHKFILKWFIEHPQFLKNEFYIAGDSYAGKFVAIIAQEVVQGLEARISPVINLKGYIVGNGVTGDTSEYNSRVPYAYGVGIISYEFFQLVETKCEGQNHRIPLTSDCATCIDAFEEVISEINDAHILEPKCADALTKSNHMNQRHRTLIEKDYMGFLAPPPLPQLQCRSYARYLSYFWANNNATREALGIKKGTKEEWERCANGLPYTSDVATTVPIHFNLTSRGYRALVYSGDHDMVVPFLGTQAWIRSLNFPVIQKWRSWRVDGQVAGYTTTYSNNLTFATIKGGGHTAPEYKPKESLAMLQRWLSYEGL